jgi:GNAT superfamily N-acetyltransferase
MTPLEGAGRQSYVTRRLTEADADAAREIFADSLRPLAAEPGPEQVLLNAISGPSAAGFRTRFTAALRYFCSTDPDGVWLAEVGDASAGVAVATVRDQQWSLALLFVRPQYQGCGIGRALLGKALGSSESAKQAMILSSSDPRAIRSYARAGFRLNPTVAASGTVVTEALAPRLPVRPGSTDDLRLVEAVDRQVRQSSRVQDVDFLLSHGGELLIADGTEKGYVVHFGGAPIMDGNPLMLAAESITAARGLLTAGLTRIGPQVQLGALTAQQWWAIEISIDAGLTITPGGPLFAKGVDSLPSGWIPSGVFF